MPLVSPRVLRIRTIITHSTPTRRQIVDELTLFNDGTEDLPFVILEYQAYRPAMEVTDEDGRSLGILTNEMVREILSQLKDPDATRLLKEINSREKYVQWLSIPSDRPFKPYQTRIIRFTYTLAEDLREYKRDTLTKRLFDIPQFDVVKVLSKSEHNPTKILVIPPEGFRIGIETCKVQEIPEIGNPMDLRDGQKHYHLTASDNIIDANLPHIEGSRLDFALRYGIYLERNEETVLKSFILGLNIFAIFFGLVVLGIIPNLYIPTFSIGRTVIPKILITSKIISQENTITTVVTLLALAFIGLSTNRLTHPTKYWAFAAILITIFAVLFSPF